MNHENTAHSFTESAEYEPMNIKKGTKLIAIDRCIMNDTKQKALNLGEEYEVLRVFFCPVDKVQTFEIKSNVGMHTFEVDEANQFFKLKNEKPMTTSLYKEEQTATELITLIEKWGADRNFYGIGGATVQSQFVKLGEEFGELAGNIARGKDCKDDIGDMVVVLTHIARLAGTNLTECIKVSYNDIKDRKGEFKNGSFIKESDLLNP